MEARPQLSASHPSLGLLAIATGNSELVLFSTSSLQRLQRLQEAGCRALAWHPSGPSLAAFVVRSSSAAVLLFTNVAELPTSPVDSGGPLQLRCALHLDLGADTPAWNAGLCLSSSHLLVGGPRLRVWGCSFSDGFAASASPHFLHCAEEPELQHLLPLSLGPVSEMRLDPSERFLVTQHAGHEASPRVWWVSDGPHAAAAQGRAVHARGRKAIFRTQGGVPQAHAEQYTLDGAAALVLEHDGAVCSLRWCPTRCCDRGRGRAPAVLAVVTVRGSVVLWRENAATESLCFLVEAFWRPDVLWACPQVACPIFSLCWAAASRLLPVQGEGPELAARGRGGGLDWGERLGLPLRPSGHSPELWGCAPATPSSPAETFRLAILRADGYLAAFLVQLRSPSMALEVCRMPAGPPLPLTCHRDGRLFHAAVAAGEDGSVLDLWLQAGVDACRLRVEGSKAVAFTAVGSVAADPGLAAEAQVVEAVVAHRALGFAACLAQAPVGPATIWVGEVPAGRATLVGERYRVPEGAMSWDSLGSLRLEGGVRALCWAPGHAVPPLLLAVRRDNGELLSCPVDPVRGVLGPGDWATVCWAETGAGVRGVQQLETLQECEEARAAVCLLLREDCKEPSSGLRLRVGRLLPPSPGGVHKLQVLYEHGPSLPGSGACCALEWLACPAALLPGAGFAQTAPQAGELVGQVALWAPAPVATSSVPDVQVTTLVVEVGETVAIVAETQPFLAGLGREEARVLSLAVAGDWLVGLLSSARVLVWCLTSPAAHQDAEGGRSAELRRCFSLATQPRARAIDAAPNSGRPTGTPFRPWNSQGPVSQSGHSASSQHAIATSSNSCVQLQSGQVVLHRFAGGALGCLAAGHSESDVALPITFLCAASAGEGEEWHSVDLSLGASPVCPEALCWLSDGCLLHAGFLDDGASVAQASVKPSGKMIALLSARLTDHHLDLLRASTPCPAYHPDTLTWLLRRGDEPLVRKALHSLLQGLQGATGAGVGRNVSPLLDLPWKDFAVALTDSNSAQGREPAASAEAQTSTEFAQEEKSTAAALFGDDEDDIAARLARLRRSWASLDDDEDEDEGGGLGATPAVQPTAATPQLEESTSNWQLPAGEQEQLAVLLQRMRLPLVSAHEQPLLLLLLQDLGPSPRVSDLDECGRRYAQAFEVHAALSKPQLLQRSHHGGEVLFLQHLSSADCCWALHSACQGTLVERILRALGPALDWPALRRAGLGLWLTDMAAHASVLEALPRSVLKKQGQEIQPESVALWYALLGRRTLLASLYRQQKQSRVAEFLGNDLSEDPWRTKAEKNAFELVRQRRFELACAFFLFAGAGRNAIEVCVRYLDDWSLALFIGQHLKAKADEEATAEMHRVLLEGLRPLAERAGDPWLASLACWQAGEHHQALQSLVQPLAASQLADTAAAARTFGTASLRHAGVSPALPHFTVLLRGVLAKRHVPEASLTEALDAAVSQQSSSALISRAYLARRQPLLALPGQGTQLPWRTALGVCRAMAVLLCAGGQPLVQEDGSVLPSGLAAALPACLGLPAEVVRAALAEACDIALREEQQQEEPWTAYTDVAPFYSPSSSPQTVTGVAFVPYLRPYVDMARTWVSSPEGASQANHCRVLRGLSPTYALRALLAHEYNARVAGLEAVVWRVLPQLRLHLLEPSSLPLPVPVMHLAVHLICAPCVSRPPAPVLGSIEDAKNSTELPGDLAHVVTALALTLALLLALRSLMCPGVLRAGLEAHHAHEREGNRDAGEELEEEKSAPAPTPPWEVAFWQGLRVLLGHLEGTPQDMRRLHRSGALPSLIVSLFLQPTFPEEEQSPSAASFPLPQVIPPSDSSSLPREPSRSNAQGGSASPTPSLSAMSPRSAASEEQERGTAAFASSSKPEDALRALLSLVNRDKEAESLLQQLLHCLLAELSLERLVVLLSSIRRKPAGVVNHWITTCYEALLSSLRSFLHGHIRGRVLQAARGLSAAAEGLLPAALCCSDSQLGEVLGHCGGGAAFLALWEQLGGTRRLQLLFAHHPVLRLPAARLPSRSAVLWRASGTGSAPRFVCAERGSGCLRLAVHALGRTWDIHPGHAARWGAAEGDEGGARYEPQAEALAAALFGQAPLGPGPVFDVTAELLLGGAVPGPPKVCPLLPLPEHGVEVGHFLSTLLHGGGNETMARVAAVRGPGIISAESHPGRPTYAVACDDCSVHLWAFGAAAPHCTLPQLESKRRNTIKTSVSVVGSGFAADASVATAPVVLETLEREQKRCQLVWNLAGDRLLGIGDSAGVCLWTVSEGRGSCQVCPVVTGAAQTRVACGTFVSPASIIATGGKLADADTLGSAKSWPYVAAGLCVWDMLAPPHAALVAHDAGADAPPCMPPEYSSLAWFADRQQILCGTKAGELRIYDLRQRRVAQRFEAHSGSTLSHLFHLESTGRLITLSAAAELKVWSLPTMECLEVHSRLHRARGVGGVGKGRPALSCATMLSEQHLVTGGHDGIVMLTRV